MTDKPEILDLIAKYFNNPDDSSLRSRIEEFRLQSKENEIFFKEMEKIWNLSEQAISLESINEEEAFARFQARLSVSHQANQHKRVKLTPLRWIAAAAILILIGTTIYVYKDKGISSKTNEHQYVSDALPGGNKAVLVLADGRKVSLTDINNGDVAKEAGLSITKTADGQLVYTVLETGKDNQDNQLNNAVNTIETPKGGMWHIKLPDGSDVWLNAASSITYPLAFSKGEKRMVQLKGEAYFEVAVDKLHPFVVKTINQEVEVLGTHFNINAYSDEAVVKTTLLEGSVKVNLTQGRSGEILKPGQQSLLTSTGLDVKEVDAEEAIDWKNGYFKFNNEKQESIMRKIARWYNVQIEYADASAKEVTYYGSISRFDNISKILRKFEQTGQVRFEVEKNKITVYKD